MALRWINRAEDAFSARARRAGQIARLPREAALGEPGERECFDVHRINAQGSGRSRGRQVTHERGVMCAAAAHKELG
jgi:hypothetical protein